MITKLEVFLIILCCLGVCAYGCYVLLDYSEAKIKNDIIKHRRIESNGVYYKLKFEEVMKSEYDKGKK